MLIARIIGWVIFLTGLPLLATDVLVWSDTGFWSPMALGQLWQYLDYPSMNFVQGLIDRFITPYAWDPVIVAVLVCWAFAALMASGLLIVILARRSAHRRQYLYLNGEAGSTAS